MVYIKILIAIFFWGGTWVSGRMLAQGVSPATAAFLRYVCASVCIFFLYCRIEGHLPRLKKNEILPVVGLGLTGVFLYNWMFFFGLQTVSAGRGALIIATTPAIIALLSGLFYKERFGVIKVFGIVLALSGAITVISKGDVLGMLSHGVSTGDLFILGCVGSWTAYTLLGKLAMRTLSPVGAVAWSCFIGTVFLFFPAMQEGLFEQVANARFLDWVNVFYLGVFGTVISFSWYYEGVKALGPSRAGVFINLVPVAALVLAFFILGETVSSVLFLGAAFVITGVWFTNRPQKTALKTES